MEPYKSTKTWRRTVEIALNSFKFYCQKNNKNQKCVLMVCKEIAVLLKMFHGFENEEETIVKYRATGYAYFLQRPQKALLEKKRRTF